MATVAEVFTLAWQNHQAGNISRAEQLYRHILRHDPRHVDALCFLGILYSGQSKFDEAVNCLRQALQIQPNDPEKHNNLGVVLDLQEKREEAISHYQRALRLRPGFVAAHYNLAIAFHKQGKLNEATDNFQEALRLQPDHVDAHNNLAIVRMQQGRLDDAMASCQQALRINPNHVEAWLNQGNTLLQLDRPDDAIRSYQQALRVKPDYAQAHTNIGRVHQDEGRFHEALVCFEQALRQNQGFAEPHHNRALLWLLVGNWSQGWPEFEWRWQTTDFPRFAFRQPRWDGSPLAGRTLLVMAEQGLGDTIQFIRYARLLQQRSGRVILTCQPPLQRLLLDCWGMAQVVVQGTPLPEFDVYAPLLSIPGRVGTAPASVPADVPYLHAKDKLVSHWKSSMFDVRCAVSEEPHSTPHIEHRTSNVLVGIAWQGSPTHRAQRYDKRRSIPLANFARLAAVPGVHLVSVQKGPGRDQLPAAAEKFPVLDLSSRLDEDSGAFMDTAALMKNLDLVISCDTAIAHLAGALAVPTWVALPLIPDWRWLLEREDSPWYPATRLFRQTRQGNWEDLFDRMAEELAAVVSCQLSDHEHQPEAQARTA